MLEWLAATFYRESIAATPALLSGASNGIKRLFRPAVPLGSRDPIEKLSPGLAS